MINFTDMTGLASSVVALLAMAAQLPGVARLPRPRLALLLSAIAIAVLIPLGGLPLAAYVRGWMGDLSISSLVLLLMAVWRKLAGAPITPSPCGGGLGWGNERDNYVFLFFISLAALFLYPMALGIGYFDPYKLGYGGPWLLGGLLLLALACFRRFPLIALAIALAVFAWGVGWYESGNLWDYLLDPLLAIYAIGALLWRGVQTLLKSWRGRP